MDQGPVDYILRYTALYYILYLAESHKPIMSRYFWYSMDSTQTCLKVPNTAVLKIKMVGSKSGSSTVSLGKNPYPACYLAGFFPFSLSFSLTSSEKNPSTHNLQEFCCSLGHSPAAWLHHCIYLYLTPSLTKKITRCRVIYGVCYQLCETLKYAK